MLPITVPVPGDLGRIVGDWSGPPPLEQVQATHDRANAALGELGVQPFNLRDLMRLACVFRATEDERARAAGWSLYAMRLPLSAQPAILERSKY